MWPKYQLRNTGKLFREAGNEAVETRFLKKVDCRDEWVHIILKISCRPSAFMIVS